MTPYRIHTPEVTIYHEIFTNIDIIHIVISVSSLCNINTDKKYIIVFMNFKHIAMRLNVSI